jgi:nicotinamide-nucleotide amidase
VTAKALLKAATAKGAMIATAESCTGGMVAAAITDIPGSSAIFDRGFVTYTNAAKIQMLDVQATTLTAHGAVSEQIAAEMAQGAVKHAQVDLAVAITGIAGPGGSDHKPEGRVCFGMATLTDCQTETIEFGALGRDNVRHAATGHALDLLLAALEAFPDKTV